jgi:hypothetical protein
MRRSDLGAVLPAYSSCATSMDKLNHIRELRTHTIDRDDGLAHAIMVAIDVPDANSAEAFVSDLAGKVLSQRLISPPDTDMMLVTIIGELSARQFVRLWQRQAAANPALSVFMNRMSLADVIHGTSAGEILDQCSLTDPIGND